MYDVVIIGSGLGGLICARQLARSGRSVVVLERQRAAGGCLQSYRRGGLEFDTGLHYVGGLAEGEPLHDAFSELGLLRLPWHRMDVDGLDRVTIGSETFALAQGFDRFVATLAARFPGERRALQQFAEDLRQLPPLEESIQTSAYAHLTSLFHDPLLVAVVSAAGMKMELRKESLPWFNLAHGLSSYVQSSWRLRGSGNLIVDALVGDFLSAGGELCCGAEVQELVERDGRVVSARCTDGRVFEGRVFISDVHPQLTFAWLQDSQRLRGLFRRRIAGLENTFGMFTVALVLKPGALPYFNHNKYVYRTSDDVWEPPRLSGQAPLTVDRVMVSARVPEEGQTCVRQLDLLTPLPWERCEPWAATTVGHRGKDYAALKDSLSDACIALAERVVPGLHALVEQRFTSTPLTWRDYTLSPCGSAFGVRKDCRNPLLTMLSPRTPIANLLLTGQSLVLHGLEGVTRTAFSTLQAFDNIEP